MEGFEDRVLVPFLGEAPKALLPRAILLEWSPGEWASDLPAALAERGYAASPAPAGRYNHFYLRGGGPAERARLDL